LVNGEIMHLNELQIKDVCKNWFKKLVIETSSIKFWAAVYLGYLNYHIIIETGRFDVFGISAFLGCIGIREIADFYKDKNVERK